MDNYDNYGNWFPVFLIYSIIALVSASPPIFACSNCFLGFSFVLVVIPQGLMEWLQALTRSLIHEEKPTVAASKRRSLNQNEWVLYVFVKSSIYKHRIMQMSLLLA